MNLETQTKCAKLNCNCMAHTGSNYCSSSCEDVKGMKLTEIGCGCSHADCDKKAAPPARATL